MTERLDVRVRGQALAIVAVSLIALNLRPFLAGIGPVVENILVDTQAARTSIAALTALPLAIMGLGAFLAPRLHQRIGAWQAVMLGLLALCLGSVMRALPSGIAGLLLTSAVCGLGVAVLQAMMPAFIKSNFAARFGAVMGLYSALLLGGGALGAQIVPILSEATGSWRFALAALGVPAAIALVVAATALRPTLPLALSVQVHLRATHPVMILILAFGLLNMGYGSVIAWLAPFFATQGMTPETAGSLIAVMSICQALSAVALPLVGRRGGDMRPRMYGAIIFQMLGFSALIFSVLPSLFTVCLLGFGLGGTFSIMLIIIMQYSRGSADAVRLSSTVQGGGFLITALSPLLSARLLDLGYGYEILWAVHLIILAFAAVLIARLAPSRS